MEQYCETYFTYDEAFNSQGHRSQLAGMTLVCNKHGTINSLLPKELLLRLHNAFDLALRSTIVIAIVALCSLSGSV